MSAAEALRAAQAVGVSVKLDGEGLLLEADREPPRAVVDALIRYKPAILHLLRPAQGGWVAEQWHAYFEERCRAAARNGVRSCVRAEAIALTCCIVEWLNQHPAPSAPGRCAWCGKAEHPSAVVLPLGAEPVTHTWLHAECWHGWHQARRADAIAALGTMGIASAD